MKKYWKNIAIGDTFSDGSKVLSIHEKYIDDCYKIYYNNESCILSETHLLLCNIKDLNKECYDWVIENFGNYKIPTLYDQHLYYSDSSLSNLCYEKLEVIDADISKISDYEIWLPIKVIFILIRNFYQKIYCNNNLLYKIEYFGKKEVFCVETNTHKFETCNLIHHNSVTLRNIIFHCLTHGEQISIALIDLKYTEFTPFKGFKNVVAVANTVQEAVEVMRVAREVMYKRNQEMAKLGINNISDYKPQKPTNEVIVAGRKLNDNDNIEIKTKDGEIKTITVKELEEYL